MLMLQSALIYRTNAGVEGCFWNEITLVLALNVTRTKPMYTFVSNSNPLYSNKNTRQTSIPTHSNVNSLCSTRSTARLGILLSSLHYCLLSCTIVCSLSWPRSTGRDSWCTYFCIVGKFNFALKKINSDCSRIYLCVTRFWYC